MSQERTSVSKEGLGSLGSCLMGGNAEERRATRKARRRALIVSIIVQILVLAALVMYPMLGRGERLAFTAFTPVIPYSYSGGPAHPAGDNLHHGTTPKPGRFYVTLYNSPIFPNTGQDTTTQSGGPDGPDIPGVPSGPFIPGAPIVTTPSRDPEPPPEAVSHAGKKRISMCHIEAALLVHRVEPVYPPVPLQLHREGRVELHAIIATDGSIQELQVLSGDPFFYASALAAVREWRYRPTYLDGQAVEVETQISVIYTLNR